MASLFCTAIGVDTEDLEGKFVVVREDHGSNANFVVNCLMIERLQKGGGVCLVALHNTFGHYHNVSMKLGQNLHHLQGKGLVDIVEPLKIFRNNLKRDESEVLNFLSEDKESIVRELFYTIKNKIENMQNTTSSVCLIIDDFSDLLSLGIPLKYVLSLLQYCRTLLRMPGVSLVILSHVAEGDEELEQLVSGAYHVADIRITVSGLKTGQSSDVTGSLRVSPRDSSAEQQWNKQTHYLFKLHDRQVTLLAPGTLTSLS